MSLFKRGISGKHTRKTEEKKAKKKHVTSSDYQDIRNRLGLRSDAPKEKIVFELNRLKGKSRTTWKVLKLTEADFKKFGIQV